VPASSLSFAKGVVEGKCPGTAAAAAMAARERAAPAAASAACSSEPLRSGVADAGAAGGGSGGGCPTPPRLETGLDVLLSTAMGGPSAGCQSGGGCSGGGEPDADHAAEVASPAAPAGSASSSVTAADGGVVASSGSKRRHSGSGGGSGAAPAPAAPSGILLARALQMTKTMAPKVRRTAGMRGATAGRSSVSAAGVGSHSVASSTSADDDPASISSASASKTKVKASRPAAAAPAASSTWNQRRAEETSLASSMAGVVPSLLPGLGDVTDDEMAGAGVHPQERVDDDGSLPPMWVPPALGAVRQHSFDPSAPSASAMQGDGTPGGSSVASDDDDGADALLGALVGSTFGDLSHELDDDDEAASAGGGSDGMAPGFKGSGGSVTSTTDQHSVHVSTTASSPSDSPLSHVLASFEHDGMSLSHVSPTLCVLLLCAREACCMLYSPLTACPACSLAVAWIAAPCLCSLKAACRPCPTRAAPACSALDSPRNWTGSCKSSPSTPSRQNWACCRASHMQNPVLRCESAREQPHE
jgi:hypothetical protein